MAPLKVARSTMTSLAAACVGGSVAVEAAVSSVIGGFETTLLEVQLKSLLEWCWCRRRTAGRAMALVSIVVQ